MMKGIKKFVARIKLDMEIAKYRKKAEDARKKAARATTPADMTYQLQRYNHYTIKYLDLCDPIKAVLNKEGM